VAQGIANIASAMFGGISVTGTIARTATNVRAGATSPVAGMLHALFVLVFLLVAAPLAGYVPLAALAGVLVAVCWYMADRKDFAMLLRQGPAALVMLVTFGLTVIRDLSTGIVAGCILAAVLTLFHRGVDEEGA
jgi:SulP family sulfate permease